MWTVMWHNNNLLISDGNTHNGSFTWSQRSWNIPSLPRSNVSNPILVCYLCLWCCWWKQTKLQEDASIVCAIMNSPHNVIISNSYWFMNLLYYFTMFYIWKKALCHTGHNVRLAAEKYTKIPKYRSTENTKIQKNTVLLHWPAMLSNC